MKETFSILLLICSIWVHAQEEWAAGTIYFSDGQELKSDMRLIVSFNEGSLQAKKQDQIATLSPRTVDRFIYYDSLFEKYREFESIQTQFRKRAGSKKVFLELLYEGSEYSLYRRYIPVAKLSTVVIPLPNYHIGWAIWAEGRIEPALFVYQKDDKAYQITKGIENLFETRKEKRLDYKLDESTLKTLLGEKYKQMRKAVNKTNLSINYEKGLIEGMKYLNGSAFQYNRKETPKKLRN